MKEIFLLAALTCYTTIAALAQHDHSNHENQNTKLTKDTNTKATITDSSQLQLTQLLSSYYNIKNALVNGDANSAAINADLFLKIANTINFKLIPEDKLKILSKNAGKILGMKNLTKQREHFADLSSTMAAVAKSLKSVNQPIYLQYCPMKNAGWLSSEKQIKNPYYGSSMLTCGEVTETL